MKMNLWCTYCLTRKFVKIWLLFIYLFLFFFFSFSWKCVSVHDMHLMDTHLYFPSVAIARGRLTVSQFAIVVDKNDSLADTFVHYKTALSVYFWVHKTRDIESKSRLYPFAVVASQWRRYTGCVSYLRTYFNLR